MAAPEVPEQVLKLSGGVSAPPRFGDLVCGAKRCQCSQERVIG